MLKELGASFKFEGGETAIQMMQKLATSFGAMHKDLGSGVPQSTKHMENLAKSAKSMAQSIQSSMNMAKAATAAFLAGKAFSGVTNWLKGNDQVAAYQDFFRSLGVNDQGIAALNDHLAGLRRRMPRVGPEDYHAATQDTLSIFGANNIEAVKKANETVMYMAKAGGPKVSFDEAAAAMRIYQGNFGQDMSPDELLKGMEGFMAKYKATYKNSTARGHDLMMAMRQAAPSYSGQKGGLDEMLATLGSVVGAMGEPGGEAVRALQAEKGAGYGKLMAEIWEQEKLSGYNATHGTHFRSMDSLPAEMKQKLHKQKGELEKQWQGSAIEAMEKDSPLAYMGMLINAHKYVQNLQKSGGHFDAQAAEKKAFEATGARSLQILAKALEGGTYQKLLKEIQTADPKQAKAEIDDSFKSFSSRYEIMKQQAEDLRATVARTFQPVIMPEVDSYGKWLSGIADMWKAKSPEMITNLTLFKDAFKSAFEQAYGPVSGIQAEIERITKALADSKQVSGELGAEWGKLAGTKLGAMSEDIKQVYNNIKELLPPLTEFLGYMNSIMKGISSVAGLPGRALSFLGAAHANSVYDRAELLEKNIDVPKKLAAAIRKAFTPNVKAGADVPLDDPSQWLAPAHAAPPAEMVASPRNGSNSGAESGQTGPAGSQTPAPSEPNLTVNTYPSFSVDGRELAVMIANQVSEILNHESDRRLNTAGSFSGMFAK
jgi:uncharacterized protein YukE